MTYKAQVNAKFGARVVFSDTNFRQFIQASRDALLSRISMMLSYAEAEEVVQEAYLKLYMHLHEQKSCKPLESDYFRCKALLYSIAKHIALNRIKHQNVVTKHQLSQNNSAFAASNPEDNMVEQDEKRLLESAIASLPHICRQIFVDRKIHGKSYQEISKDYGICIKTVENHIARGLKLCRQYIMSQKRKSHLSTKSDKYHQVQESKAVK